MNILFVCTGNTCRSPMAEAMLKDLAKNNGLNNLRAGSAGIVASSGQEATRQAVRVMKELGISLLGHRTRQISESLLKQADLILTMTQGHKSAVQAAAPSVWNKIHTLKEFAGMEDRDISDPFGQSDDTYRRTAEEIRQALEAIVDKLKE